MKELTIVTNVEDGCSILGIYENDDYARYLHDNNDRNRFSRQIVDESKIPESVIKHATDLASRNLNDAIPVTEATGGTFKCCKKCGSHYSTLNEETGLYEDGCSDDDVACVYPDGLCTEFEEC